MPDDKELIRNCLSSNYGIEAPKLTLLPLGADWNASVYQAQAVDGALYFVKRKRGRHSDIGVKIVELLHQAGIQEIIPPIKTLQGQPSQNLEDGLLIVYPFIRGEDGFSRSLTEMQWRKLGKALRRIHDMDVPQTIQNQIRREDYSPKWRQAVRGLYHLFESEPAGDEIAMKLRKFIKGHLSAIRRLVDRAEQLGQKLQYQEHKFVLCHSDIHGGNVLMVGSNFLYIVDWDDPIMAPKERDLMFIGGGVANVWNKVHEEELFYQGYGKTDVNPLILAYYRHERIVEDIAEYAQKLLLTTTGGDERSVMYKQFTDMFEPNGVVDIALNMNSI